MLIVKKFRFMARMASVFLIICLPLLDELRAMAAEIRFLYPSPAESVVAPGRDFYAIGSMDVGSGWGSFTFRADLYGAGRETPVQSLCASNMDYRDGAE